jgi:3-dehydroquinate synthase
MTEMTLMGKSNASSILIEEGLLEKCGKLLDKKYPKSHFAIITDANLEKIYSEKLTKTIPRSFILGMPSGEKSKDIKTVMSLAEELLKNEIGRSDVIIGFGGGMPTDVAGFLASIYMRGIRYVAIPTSLLGMVDASIGGKAGIDFIAKNILGSFYLPEIVLIDPNFLKSFADPKKMPGMGEVVKYAAIADTSLFKDFKKDPLDLNTIIKKSVKTKVDIVKQDFEEHELRKILNFGHTFGHAIESALDYKISHDQAISIGMVIANRIAQNLNRQNPLTGSKIRIALEQFGLPTELPKGLQIEDLVEYIKKDKKRHGDKIWFIIVPELGSAEIVPLKPEELIKLAK